MGSKDDIAASWTRLTLSAVHLMENGCSWGYNYNIQRVYCEHKTLIDRQADDLA